MMHAIGLDWPRQWLVVFRKKSGYKFINYWPCRFRHCFCFAWIDPLQAWVVVEYAGLGGSTISWVKAGEDIEFLARVTDGTTILQVDAGTTSRLLPGIYCVPLTAQVTGVRSCALSVDGFFRDCLAHGAKYVVGEIDGRFDYAGHGRQNPSPAAARSADYQAAS